jgi:hypothetical protein
MDSRRFFGTWSGEFLFVEPLCGQFASIFEGPLVKTWQVSAVEYFLAKERSENQGEKTSEGKVANRIGV